MSDRYIYYYYYWVRTTVYLCTTFPIPMRRKRFCPLLCHPSLTNDRMLWCYTDVASTLRCINFFPVPLTDWYGAIDRLQSDLREMLKSMTLKRSCRPHDLCSMLLFNLPLSLLLYFIFIHFSPLLGCCHPRCGCLYCMSWSAASCRVCRSSDRGNEKRAAAANPRWMGFCSWSHSFLLNKTYTYLLLCRARVFTINLIIMRPATLLYDPILSIQSGHKWNSLKCYEYIYRRVSQSKLPCQPGKW